MSKRKRKADSYIPGLTRKIISNVAASFSYERGEELMNHVSIDSNSDNTIQASIDGKGYEIEISFESTVQNEFDLDCDCSCPDDRDGCCKHLCAVLLTLIDNSPKNKKRKTSKSNSTSNSSKNKNKKKNKQYSLSDLKASIENLGKDQLLSIVQEGLKYVCIQKIVSNTLNSASNKQIDLSDYKQRIYEAVHQLDRLRPSQQFSLAYKIHEDLNEIIDEAQELFALQNNNAAMQILIAIAKGISSEANIAGEVFKSLHGCAGMDDSIASLMAEILESDQDMQKNKVVHKAIKSIAANLSDYGDEQYSEILESFDIE